MATFNKGESMKNQRVHVSSVFDQGFEQKDGRRGKNVQFSIANDHREGRHFTDPMLVYDNQKGVPDDKKVLDENGKPKTFFTGSYSASQWDKIEAAANKDGDKLVVNADLFPSKNKEGGLAVNTNTLTTPDKPFDQNLHVENTKKAREAKAQAREDAKNAPAQETEKDAEPAV